MRKSMLGIAAVLASLASTQAGHVKYDFNSDPSALLDFLGSTSTWVPSGGSTGGANDGYLSINVAQANQLGAILFNDFDSGLVVAGFTFGCDLRIGNGTQSPADGFSINHMRSFDPVLKALDAGDTIEQMRNAVSPNGGTFSDNGDSGDPSLPEEGTTTGLSIGFDAWDSGDYREHNF